MAQLKKKGFALSGSLKSDGVTFYTKKGKIIMRSAISEQPLRRTRGQFVTRQRIAHTTARKVIFEERWLFNKNGEKCTPQEIAETNQLSHIYNIANNDIFFFLGIKISDDLKGLTKEQKEAIDIVNKFKESGYTLRDMENLLAQIKAGKKLS